MRISHHVQLPGLAAAALITSLLLTACQQQQEAQQTPLRPVRYIVVADGVEARSRTFSGATRSSQESRLSFKVAGTVTQLPIQAGDELSQGDLIARLDASQYQLQEQQSQAALVQAQASSRNTDANYERVKGLYENNNASRNDLDSARAAAESATAQVRSAQKQLELAQLNVSYTTLRAAVDCSVAQVSVEVNENVNAGTQVALVNCGQGLEVDISVPEGLISQISEGMPATIRMDAIADSDFAGTVTEIGVATTGGATFPVTVSFNQSNPALRVGLAAEVEFEFSRGDSSVVLIPLAALINRPDGVFVFVAEPDDNAADEAQLSLRQIEIGELTVQGVEILSGLQQGDRVVVAGTSVVRDGQRVRL